MPQLINICPDGALQDNQSVKFTIPAAKFDREGMLIRKDGCYHAYYNECAHICLPLDWEDNDFFSLDFKRLVCKNHGAEFEPSTGLCTAGPCTGAFLKPIAVLIKDGGVFAKIEDGAFAP